MKLSVLLTSVRAQLCNTREYGVPVIQLLQSQIAYDPSKVIQLDNVDGRQTDLRLFAKGKQVQLLAAFDDAVERFNAIDLDDDRDSGFRFEAKGLAFTITWRKRTSEERIADVQARHLAKKARHVTTPTGRITWPSLFSGGRVEAKVGFHVDLETKRLEPHLVREIDDGAGGVWHVDYSALEARVLSHMYGVPLYVAANYCRGQAKHPKADNYFRVPDRYRGLGQTSELAAWINQRDKEEFDLPAEFTRARGIELPIVGSSYRTVRQQEVLRSKGVGNMVIVAREPGNAHDPKALAVFAWGHEHRDWFHVGYVPKALNEGIERRMRELGPTVVFKGELLEDGMTTNPRFRLVEGWKLAKPLRGL